MLRETLNLTNSQQLPEKCKAAIEHTRLSDLISYCQANKLSYTHEQNNKQHFVFDSKTPEHKPYPSYKEALMSFVFHKIMVSPDLEDTYQFWLILP